MPPPSEVLAQPCTDPSVCGAWETRVGLTLGPNDTDIAGGALLPFDDGRILFWCRVKSKFTPYDTYLWEQPNSSNVTTYPLPAPSPNGAHGDAILKCSSAILLSNGDVLTTGGDNHNTSTATSNDGHPYIYRFSSLSNPSWTQETSSLTYTRWYGTSLQLPQDQVLAVANANPPHGGEQRYEFRTRTGVGAFQWEGSILDNRMYDAAAQAPCSPGPPFDVPLFLDVQYPRLRFIAHDRHAMWVDGYHLEAYKGFAHPENGRMTTYMDIDVPLCSENLPQRRWKVGRPATQVLDDNPFAHVIHIVQFDGPSGQVTDTIYRISGGDRASCGAMTFVHDWKIQNPSAANPDWTLLPNMHTVGRNLANVVVLADGSIALMGGMDASCAPQLTTRLLKPVELFPSAPQVWQDVAASQIPRLMHAVALLLPDGSVWRGGGEGAASYDANTPQPSWHTYERYKPPYMLAGQRPVIEDVGGDWSSYGGQLGALTPIVVNFGYSLEPPLIERAALIRPGVTTHHDDQHQRFVELPVVSVDVQANGKQHVIAYKPPNNSVAPEGYYMLVVIDANGRPSAGRFVKIGPNP